MWSNYHITPHVNSKGHIKFGDRYHKTRKQFPDRDVHQISNIDLRADNENRFLSDYQSRFDDAEKQRAKNVYIDALGQATALDSPAL